MKIPADLEKRSLYLPYLRSLFSLPTGNNVPALVDPVIDFAFLFPDFLLDPAFAPFLSATGIFKILIL
jgi:hypothetical protein